MASKSASSLNTPASSVRRSARGSDRQHEAADVICFHSRGAAWRVVHATRSHSPQLRDVLRSCNYVSLINPEPCAF